MKRWMVAAMVAAGAVAILAQAQTRKPEDQIKFRKAAYVIMNLSFGTLDAMAEGKRPFDKDEAVRNAELLQHVSVVPKAFFGEGTDKGEPETRARPEIWTKRADFDAKMDKMVASAAKVPPAARSADMAAFRKAVKDVDDACAACHEDYRVKRR